VVVVDEVVGVGHGAILAGRVRLSSLRLRRILRWDDAGVTELLRWDRCDAHLPHIRVSRHRFAPDWRGEAHGHDFAEWFWVESGRLRHRCEGSEEELGTGDARFLPPGQEHGFACADEAVLVTVSVPQPAFALLRRRYGGAPGWPWPARGVGRLRLDADQLRRLGSALAELPGRGQEEVDREWFVATLMRFLRRPPEAPRDAATPPWLSAAVAGLGEPRRLAEGLPGLVRLSGRSAAHLSRAVRRHYGCTATALVNRLRLERAARELRLGQAPIAAIALDCGFGNLGHFYRQFRAAFGQAPRAFRVAALGR
jgi:AraC family cel operon transcriptional repressor